MITHYEDSSDYLDEMADAIVRTSDGWHDESKLTTLDRIHMLRVKAEMTEHLAVTEAFLAGHTWGEIGAVLGMSRQAAWSKYRPRR